MKEYMNAAVEEARLGVKNNDGGPFGAVVVNREGKIIGVGHNKVLGTNDPTAHAEVVAVRDACQRIGNYSLKGCIIYSTSEPCPMCISSIIWANIKEVYYASTRKDVAKIGFRDNLIYEYLEGKQENVINVQKIDDKECKQLLDEYDDTIY